MDASREREFLDAARARGLRPPGRGPVDETLRGISAFFSRALLREDAARRPGPLQGIDPRARLAAVLLFLASVALTGAGTALLAHALLPAAALLLSRIRLREFLGAGFLPAAVFSLLMAAPATLNVVRDGTVVFPLLRLPGEWRFGPFHLPQVVGVTREGLLSAGTFLARVLASVSAVLWLTLSTRWTDLLRALRVLRLPPLLLQVAGMTVRYIHVLLRQAEEFHLGRKSRTIRRGTTASEQAWIGSRLAGSWERSLHLMEEVGAAMTARGFTGASRFPPGSRLKNLDWALLGVVALFCAGVRLA